MGVRMLLLSEGDLFVLALKLFAFGVLLFDILLLFGDMMPPDAKTLIPESFLVPKQSAFNPSRCAVGKTF